MPDVAILEPLIADGLPRDSAEMNAFCGRFIDTWLAGGGEPTDDVVIGFYSIWSQSLDVARDANKTEEKAAFYNWAYPYFVRHRDELRLLMTLRS